MPVKNQSFAHRVSGINLHGRDLAVLLRAVTGKEVFLDATTVKTAVYERKSAFLD